MPKSELRSLSEPAEILILFFRPQSLRVRTERAAKLPQHQLVNSPVKSEYVQLALRILTERRDIQLGGSPQIDQLAVGEQVTLVANQAPDPARFEIAVDVHADQLEVWEFTYWLYMDGVGVQIDWDRAEFRSVQFRV